MARGYPDYFGYSVFPWTGDIIFDDIDTGFLGGANGQVISLLGKRHILYISFGLEGLLSHLEDVISVIIDGRTPHDFQFAVAAAGKYNYVLPGVMVPNYIGADGLVINGYFCGGFTVSTQLQIWYLNASADPITVNVGIGSSPIL